MKKNSHLLKSQRAHDVDCARMVLSVPSVVHLSLIKRMRKKNMTGENIKDKYKKAHE